MAITEGVCFGPYFLFFFGGGPFFGFAGGVPSKARKEGRNAGRKKGRKEGRRQKGGKHGRKKDKKERNEYPARKEGMPGERKEARRKKKIRRNEWRTPEGRKKKEMPRKKGIREGRKEGRKEKQRKEDKKEGTENHYTLNPNPSHTNHTTTNNNL